MRRLEAFVEASVIAFLWFLPAAGASKSDETAWLKSNTGKEGVVVLPNGLQYKVLVSGQGSFHPAESAETRVHYSGSLIDGTEFDSSYRRGKPATFALDEVISGWATILQMMVEGDIWEVFIPSDLAYGEDGLPPAIQGGKQLQHPPGQDFPFPRQNTQAATAQQGR